MQLRALMTPGSQPFPMKMPGALLLDSSVGYEGTNLAVDVLAVQASLNLVLPARGGPSTLLAEDGLVGDKTIAAILSFQERWVKFRDSRIDPDGTTLIALNRAVGAIGEMSGPAPSGPAAAGSAVTVARAGAGGAGLSNDDKRAIMVAALRLARVKHTIVPAAQKGIFSAVRLATLASAYAARLPVVAGARDDPGRVAFLQMAKHFKLSEKKPKEALSGARRVEGMIRRMAITLTRLVGSPMAGLEPGPEVFISLWRQPKSMPKAPAYTWWGGAWERHRMTGWLHSGESLQGKTTLDYADRIYLLPAFDNSKPDGAHYENHVIVHELGHFIGDMEGGWTLNDLGYAYEDKYWSNTPHQRLHNADAYAIYARECHYGTVAAAKGAQITVQKLGEWPKVETAGTPSLPPAAASDPFAYPWGH